jgi:deferrochelatase/peroxidase EfeB
MALTLPRYLRKQRANGFSSCEVIELPATSIDPKDVQGLVRFGYARLTEACYLLLRIRDAAAARAWCATAPVATAEFQEHPPEVAMQVAFTWAGLSRLGVPSDVLAGFSAEFQSGMSGDENRSRRLGDVGPSAPSEWLWGGAASTPDVLVMLFSLPNKLEQWRTAQEGSWAAAFELIYCLDTSDLNGHEPFGFKDGISQPEIDWAATRNGGSDQITYTNLVAAGEFLLGYRNEYGNYTDRPLLDSNDPLGADLLPAEDMPAKKDVGRNGTFVVMRTLEQDVPGFWKFLDEQSASNGATRQQLAESMVGRGIEGQPLACTSAGPIEGIDSGPAGDSNRFTFDQDPTGTQCPLGAHIRRANPRNTDYPDAPSWWLPRVWSKLGGASKGMRTDIMASTRFHRILRRGREYGTGLNPTQAVLDPQTRDEKRGLHFLCLNANIGRQFEFVQNAWLMSTKFDGLSGESDPLLGNRTRIGDGLPTDNFTIPREGGIRRCIAGLPQFITVRGGEYFFLPGIRALRYFSRAGE